MARSSNHPQQTNKERTRFRKHILPRLRHPEPIHQKVTPLTPSILGAAPWGADGDWQTHFYDHRSHEPGSLIHAFNKPIETSSFTNIIAPPETLPSCTALGNDQCVTALQKAFDDHEKLSTRLEALARGEEEAKEAYEDAVRQREEVEQALMENKTVMGHIAGRLADEWRLKMD
jgi:hypothetical protein